MYIVLKYILIDNFLSKGFPHFGNQQIPNHFPIFQILIPNHFPTKDTWFPWLFRRKIHNFSIFF